MCVEGKQGLEVGQLQRVDGCSKVFVVVQVSVLWKSQKQTPRSRKNEKKTNSSSRLDGRTSGSDVRELLLRSLSKECL